MARVDTTPVPGGPGLKSHNINARAGFLKKVMSSASLVDFSAGAGSHVLGTFVTPCTIQHIYLVVNEAIAAATTLNVGSIIGTTTDDDSHVATFATDATVAAGTCVEVTPALILERAIVAGETVTALVDASGAAGTGWVVIEYTIDDENYPD